MRVNWIPVDHDAPDGIQVGDLVSAEAGGLPVYRVLAVTNGRAWLRDGERQSDSISSLSRLHWKAFIDG